MSEASSAASRAAQADLVLLTDLYQLTMLQAYWRLDMFEPAVFSLFVRRLPKARNYLIACGVDDALAQLSSLRFDRDALDWLAVRPEFGREFVDWLADWRFRGDVRAMREGTPFFANEPVLEVTAPLPEAQLVETLLMNQVQLQTMMASKAARVVAAAGGRTIADFGLRRVHGIDSGLKGARAFHVAGVASTSNVLAGRVYGVPLSGTMAHSYVQAHASELDAFRNFTALYPGTTLLVDTYDTLEGVRNVIRLAQEQGSDFSVGAIRLDSGDLGALARDARALLDDAGLRSVRIFASGGLDEYSVAALVEQDAPIDAFGVGTSMGVSADAPSLDIVYKLAEYRGRPTSKLATGKPVLPGPKQVFRVDDGDAATHDVVGTAHEAGPGAPLLEPAMRDGTMLRGTGERSLARARDHARAGIARLPPRLRALAPADPPYEVRVSETLTTLHGQVIERMRAEQTG
ncbi:MAG TPA: nicotinate phosphoribosyltransferase [Longimicrobiales bacterium]